MFNQNNDADIVSRLGQLPKYLNESYSEIYKNNTENLGDVGKSRVRCAFMWVMCASEPLPKDFLLEVVRISQSGDTGEKITEKALLQLCEHLLVVGSRWGHAFWKFPHASVGEWLET